MSSADPDRTSDGMSPRAQTVVALALSLVVVPGVAFLFGLAASQCLLLTAIAVVVAAALRFRPRGEEPIWWPEPIELARDRGARRDVARLSWSVSDTQVGRALRIRLRALAVRRLSRFGVDLDDPHQLAAAAGLLGDEPVRVLDLDLRSPVSAAAFERAVAALERLERHPAGRPDLPEVELPDRPDHPTEQGVR